MKKKIIIAILVLSVLLPSIYSEEEEFKKNLIIEESDYSMLLVYNNSGFLDYLHFYGDESRSDPEEITIALLQCPQNKEYLAKSVFWSTASYMTIGLSAVLGGVSVYAIETETYNSDTVSAIALPGVLAGILGSYIFMGIARENNIKAVNNYNLYILGIPVN